MHRKQTGILTFSSLSSYQVRTSPRWKVKYSLSSDFASFLNDPLKIPSIVRNEEVASITIESFYCERAGGLGTTFEEFSCVMQITTSRIPSFLYFAHVVFFCLGGAISIVVNYYPFHTEFVKFVLIMI